MRSAKSVDRRTVVKSLAGITLSGVTFSGAATARSTTSDAAGTKSVPDDSTEHADSVLGTSERDDPLFDTTENEDQLFDRGITIGRGTVDRIVDGRHVVILIEEDGVTVDQRVVPASEYPDLEEGDSVIVIFRDDEVDRVIPIHD